MIDLKPAMLSALSDLPACTALAFAHEEFPLPIIVIGDDAGRVAAQADSAPYLEEYTAQVNIYAASPASLEALTRQTDAALTALGLRRTHQQDLFDEKACAYRKLLCYRALLQGDTIYQ